MMKILIHDYAGHPFQVQLARALAAKGHLVTHMYFADDIGPKGKMEVDEFESANLTIKPVRISADYSKSNLIKRRFGDIQYGKAVAEYLKAERFDVITSANTPTEAQQIIIKQARKLGYPFIFWCQDFYSIAVNRLLAKKLPVLGRAVGAWYTRLERQQMHQSDRVIHITDAFLKQTDAWSIPRDKVSVIPNWGALSDIPQCEIENQWSRQQSSLKGARCLYSGTLALKHNPRLLLAVSDVLKAEEQMVVVASGVGVDFLKRCANDHASLRLLPLQQFDVFPQVLGSAKVLLGVIEADAGEFSVPSKILSYLCAGRPIVLAAPANNLASKIVRDVQAGIVVDPSDTEGFCKAVRFFLDNPEEARLAGHRGRQYAEEYFNIDKIACQFEALFTQLVPSDG